MHLGNLQKLEIGEMHFLVEMIIIQIEVEVVKIIKNEKPG
jgi:hypothetical protein